MKILVIGASGRTGRETVDRAVAEGHAVTALVRRPEAVAARPGVEVARGDVLDAASLPGPMAAADAVVSVVGPADRGATTVYSEGARNLLKAMDETGCRRIVCLSSAGLAIDPDIALVQRLVTRHVVQRLYREPYADMTRMEDVLAASDLDWTAVRAPMLSDRPATGGYRTAVRAHVARATGVPRADLADFLVACLVDRSTFRSWVEISV